jgi:hypothetical protein
VESHVIWLVFVLGVASQLRSLPAHLRRILLHSVLSLSTWLCRTEAMRLAAAASKPPASTPSASSCASASAAAASTAASASSAQPQFGKSWIEPLCVLIHSMRWDDEARKKAKRLLTVICGSEAKRHKVYDAYAVGQELQRVAQLLGSSLPAPPSAFHTGLSTHTEPTAETISKIAAEKSGYENTITPPSREFTFGGVMDYTTRMRVHSAFSSIVPSKRQWSWYLPPSLPLGPVFCDSDVCRVFGVYTCVFFFQFSGRSL